MSSQELRHLNVRSKQCHFSEQNSNKISRPTFKNTSSCLHVVVDSQNNKQYLRNISSTFFVMHRLRWDAHTPSNRRRFLRNFTAPKLLVRISARCRSVSTYFTSTTPFCNQRSHVVELSVDVFRTWSDFGAFAQRHRALVILKDVCRLYLLLIDRREQVPKMNHHQARFFIFF